MGTPDSPHSDPPTLSRRPRTLRFSGPWAVAIFLFFWLIAVAAIYIVIIQLKLGGERGIRSEPTPGAVEPAQSPTQD